MPGERRSGYVCMDAWMACLPRCTSDRERVRSRCVHVVQLERQLASAEAQLMTARDSAAAAMRETDAAEHRLAAAQEHARQTELGTRAALLPHSGGGGGAHLVLAVGTLSQPSAEGRVP